MGQALGTLYISSPCDMSDSLDSYIPVIGLLSFLLWYRYDISFGAFNHRLDDPQTNL